MTETKLWTTDGFVTDDPWRIIVEDEPLPTTDVKARLLVPLARYAELPQNAHNSATIGVVLQPDDEIMPLKPHLDNLALIAVTFPAFSDGRAYSQASLLRERLGFDGELRAVGDVLIDQVPLMLRCGIDSFAVSHETTIRRLTDGRLPGISAHYQPAATASRATGTFAWRHVQEPA